MSQNGSLTTFHHLGTNLCHQAMSPQAPGMGVVPGRSELIPTPSRCRALWIWHLPWKPAHNNICLLVRHADMIKHNSRGINMKAASLTHKLAHRHSIRAPQHPSTSEVSVYWSKSEFPALQILTDYHQKNCSPKKILILAFIPNVVPNLYEFLSSVHTWSYKLSKQWKSMGSKTTLDPHHLLYSTIFRKSYSFGTSWFSKLCQNPIEALLNTR